MVFHGGSWFLILKYDWNDLGEGAEYTGEADLLEYTVGDITIDNLSNDSDNNYGQVMVSIKSSPFTIQNRLLKGFLLSKTRGFAEFALYNPSILLMKTLSKSLSVERRRDDLRIQFSKNIFALQNIYFLLTSYVEYE